tara:strand:+ start:1079 stop:1738 length:660 start_codon:yes stop_codon:yes gene_type:complete
MSRKTLWTIVVGLVVVGGLVALSQVEMSSGSGDIARLVKLSIILLVIGAAVLGRGALTPKVGALVVWVAVGLLLVVGYGYRDTFERVLFPGRDSANTAGVARFEANAHGDYGVEATVDGVPVTFMVDTGASDVILSRSDAVRLGFDPDSMRYTRRYQTANGTVGGAPVTLGEIVIGGIRMSDVRASVTDGGLDQSLLGMSFLGRLESFHIRNGTLTLTR